MERLKFIGKTIKKVHNEILNTFGKKAYVYRWIHFILFSLRHLSGPDDYFHMKLYTKSSYEIKNYITLERVFRLRRKNNKKEAIELLNNKVNFCKLYPEYIKRSYIDVDNSSIDEINSFLDKNESFMCKPKTGMQGQGVIKLIQTEYKKREDVLSKIIGQGYILEEVITQHEMLNKLNPNSVNTVRIAVFRKNENVYIIGAVLKTAIDSVSDNLATGGTAMSVDIETGITFTKGSSYFSNEEYMFHPVTGTLLVGFQIPFWSEVIEMVTELTKKIHDLRWVSWDVAITPNGPCIVEGNHNGDQCIIQYLDQKGKYKLVKEINNQ